MFPFPSSTVSVTLFGTASAHVNEVAEALSVTDQQLSLDPPSISAATIDTFPDPSRKAVIF